MNQLDDNLLQHVCQDLVRSFKVQLRRDIGLKSLTDSRLLLLGTRVMNELLML